MVPHVPPPPARWLKGHAALGAILCVALWFALPDRATLWGFLSWVVLVALLVITPLALDLLSWTPPSRFSTTLASLVRWIQPFAGWLAAASFLLPTGPLAAALAAPWAAVAALLALAGLLGLPALRTAKAHQLAAWAAHFFFPFGAAWVIVTRAGLDLPSLRGTIGEPIVILTAVHFHFMGLGLPVLAHRIGHALGDGGSSRFYQACVAGIVVGPPAVAIGFTVHGAFQVAGAVVLALGVVGLSIISLTRIVPRHRGVSGVLLAVSALAGMWATPLGFLYTLVQFEPEIGIGIFWMVQFHGAVQAIGLVLSGLLGWTWASPSAPKAA